MAKLVTALEWDGYEARVVAARFRGRDISVERAFTVTLPEGTDVAATLKTALESYNLSKLDTFVAIGRASIELRQLTLPHVPLNELPDLVRFQAMRQFTNIGDDWPLDFTYIDTGSSETFQVLAAAISPELVEQIRTTTVNAGLNPRSFLLRGFAAASLIQRQSEYREGCHLLIDLLNDEADLTVMVDGQVVFMRTLRLGSEPEQRTRQLLPELRRTIIASQNQLGSEQVDRIVLFGTEEEHAELKGSIAGTLSIDVDLHNPFSQLSLNKSLQQSLPSCPGRFAPLLGILSDEAHGRKHHVDFLNPQHIEVSTGYRRPLLIGTIGLLAAGVLIAMGIWMHLHSLDVEIERLTTQSEGMDELVKRSEELWTDRVEIEQFRDGTVDWLDHLAALSNEYPPAEQAVVTRLNASTGDQQDGRLALDGYVTDSTVIDAIESELRSIGWQTSITDAQEDSRSKDFPWRFKQSVTILPSLPVTGTQGGVE